MWTLEKQQLLPRMLEKVNNNFKTIWSHLLYREKDYSEGKTSQLAAIFPEVHVQKIPSQTLRASVNALKVKIHDVTFTVDWLVWKGCRRKYLVSHTQGSMT